MTKQPLFFQLVVNSIFYNKMILVWALGTAALTLQASTISAESLECGQTPKDASRIAVAGGSLVEIIYALDMQDRIVAVDRTANFPEAAKALPQIGYVRNISAEGLLSLNPTLVLGEHDTGPPEVVAQLKSLDLDILLVPEDFSVAGIQQKIRCVATALGRVKEGERLAQQLVRDVVVEKSLPAAVSAKPSTTPPTTMPRGIVLLGLRSGAPVAAGRDTSGQGLLDMAGAINLMEFEGWKPVSVEAMAASRPDFIVIPERGLNMAGGIDALLAHPALRLTPAAQNRRVIAMDGMAMLGFGPRTVAAAANLQRTLERTSASRADLTAAAE